MTLHPASALAARTIVAFLPLLGGVALYGCTGSAGVAAESRAPAPGLVWVEPGVWVVGEASAPDEYYTSGYYWRYEDDRWYRRPANQPTWLVVETRVVPRVIVVHEHDHHAAIVARQRAQATQVAERRAQDRSDRAVDRERAAERHERDADRERALAESRARFAQQREHAAEQRERQEREQAEQQQQRERQEREQAAQQEQREQAERERRAAQQLDVQRRAVEQHRDAEQHRRHEQERARDHGRGHDPDVDHDRGRR